MTEAVIENATMRHGMHGSMQRVGLLHEIVRPQRELGLGVRRRAGHPDAVRTRTRPHKRQQDVLRANFARLALHRHYSGCPHHAGERGRQTVKRVPLSEEVTPIVPLWARAMQRQIYKPSPMPAAMPRRSLGPARVSGSNNVGRARSGIGLPSLDTSSVTWPS